MVLIYDKNQASRKIQEGIERTALFRQQKVGVIEDEISTTLGIEPRTLRSWKNPSSIANTLDDNIFYTLIYIILSSGEQLDWLAELLSATSVPVFRPLTEDLVSAYLEQVRLQNQPLTKQHIKQLITRLFLESNSKGGFRGYTRKEFIATTLQELIPLEPEQSEYIRKSMEICVEGLTLYRYLEAYIHDLLFALNKGAILRVILPDIQPYILDLIAFRSISGTTPEDHKQRIEGSIRTLKRMAQVSQSKNIFLRRISYLPPYGITVYHNQDNIDSICHVRLFTFKTPATQAPTIFARVDSPDQWFNIFVEQFELLWNHAHPHSINPT